MGIHRIGTREPSAAYLVLDKYLCGRHNYVYYRWERFPQLLQRPISGGVFGHVELNETSGSDFERNKHIKDTEACCDGNEEIACYDPVRVIPEEG